MSEPRPPYPPYGPGPQNPGPYGPTPPNPGPYGPTPPNPGPYGPTPPNAAPYYPSQPGYAPGQYPPPAQPDISQYAAPRTRPSTIVAIVAGVALIGVLLAGALLRQPAAPAPAPASPSATVSGPGMPFTMPTNPNSTGRWEILAREWSSAGVSVHVRISAASGTVTYAFQAYGNGDATSTLPSPGPRLPELTTGSLSAGEVADGWVFLGLRHGDSTLFLTTRSGQAISALPISA